MKNPQLFFNELLASRIKENPSVLASAGIQNKSLGFVVDGTHGGQWVVIFDSLGSVSLKSDTAVGDCVIQMNQETFLGLLEGTVNVAMAFMFRKIKVSGDKNLAIKIGQTLQKVLV
jgi:putative sterol carrier protein